VTTAVYLVVSDPQVLHRHTIVSNLFFDIIKPLDQFSRSLIKQKHPTIVFHWAVNGDWETLSF